MMRTFLTTLLLSVMLGQGAVMAQPGIQGEAALMEGEGLFSLLQGPGLAASPAASSDPLLHSGTGSRPEAGLLTPGEADFIAIRQIGEGNLIDLSGYGTDNAIDLTQTGFNNQAVVTQYGHGNALTQHQQGNDLSIEVTQYGGAQIAISQSGY